jgi:single-stranded-DNA-specific exonuclease
LGGMDLRPTLKADAEIPLSDLHPELLKDLAWLQPTGHDNPEAAFVSRNLKVIRSRTVGKDSTHLKLTVTDGRITYDAIAFRLGHWQAQMPGRVDLMYSFETNVYNGQTYLQLNVRDLKPAGTPDRP